MAEKIEGHVHWTGTVWQFFKTFNPAMACEFADHRTCKAASDVINAATQAAEDALAAEAQGVQDAIDSKNEAARRRRQAQKEADMTKIAGWQAAKDKAADAIAKASAYYVAETKAANDRLATETDAVTNAAIAAQKVIDSTDWAGQVAAEEQAAVLAQKAADDKAKADADAAAAKAQADADAAALAAQAPAPAPTPDAPAPAPTPDAPAAPQA